MKTEFVCPKCGSTTLVYKNPLPTVDIIIRIQNGFILIKRKNPPFGWALPGGFVDYGESVESAAVRETKEETSLNITDLKLFGVYSAPERDPRHHTISTVFTARGHGAPQAGDDAIQIQIFNKDNFPKELAFDHLKILHDFFSSGF